MSITHLQHLFTWTLC